MPPRLLSAACLALALAACAGSAAPPETQPDRTIAPDPVTTTAATTVTVSTAPTAEPEPATTTTATTTTAATTTTPPADPEPATTTTATTAPTTTQPTTTAGPATGTTAAQPTATTLPSAATTSTTTTPPAEPEPATTPATATTAATAPTTTQPTTTAGPAAGTTAPAATTQPTTTTLPSATTTSTATPPAALPPEPAIEPPPPATAITAPPAVAATTTAPPATTAPPEPTVATIPAPPATEPPPPTTATAPPAATTTTAPAEAEAPRRYRPQTVEILPHDRMSFTQGLAWRQGVFYESAGLYGRSSVRIVDPATGEVIKERALDDQYFGEGLEVVGERVVQLTWREETAFVWQTETLAPLGTFSYSGEGWGLCAQADRFVMSDGSDVLTFRHLETFAPLGSVRVARNGEPVTRLNELECVSGLVYANIWLTDSIAVIDPAQGTVTALVDASGLAGMLDDREGVDVLNGIAYRPDRDRFYLTGKLWPNLFEVELVPDP